jgi:hypothetical protein
MQCVRIFFTGLVGLTLTFVTLAYAAPLRGESPSTSNYFVDFRARSGGVVGHTYVVYGNIDSRGRILRARAAGFYPHGKFSESVLSALLPMPGYVGLEPSDRGRPPSVIYRRRMNADAYARFVTTVETLRKRQPVWHLLFFNCNTFTAKLARSIGLRAPPSLEFPNDFVRGLYSMNRPTGIIIIRSYDHQ